MLNWAWTRNVMDTDRKSDLFSSIVPLYVLWKQPSKQDVFIQVYSLDKDNSWRSFNNRNCQLKIFFSDMILFDIFCTQPKKVVALSINTYMFWMSIWICLMTIINTHYGRGMSFNIPHPWQKVITLAKLHNVRNRYLMRHRSFYKALYQMLGGLPSAKIENGMSYFM